MEQTKDSLAEVLTGEVSLTAKAADEIEINSAEKYAAAAQFVVEIKKMATKVKEYWEPLRISSKQAYDEVLARKKEMLFPLENAETAIKSKMAVFHAETEKRRREMEEEIRRSAQQEVDRKLAEAAEAEKAGDALRAEIAMGEADVIDDYASVAYLSSSTKAQGVSTRQTWKIVSIDPSKVPICISGVEIRPVDEKAVIQLIKAAKGNISIPGVVFKEDVIISVRS